jgi:hypothetical protein
MLSHTTELIEYKTATHLAQTYTQESARIRSAIVTIGEACDRLASAFGEHYSFRPSISNVYRSAGVSLDEEGAAEIVLAMKRECWKALIGKLGIEKLMSSKRREELREALDSTKQHADDLPEIHPDTMLDVLAGYVDSAEEFLLESIREEYDYWKPQGAWHGQYKTNDLFKLGRKIIRGWIVERWSNAWHVCYRAEPHLTSLDRIFHALDGAGRLKEHRGPLVSAIMTSTDGTGETEYFRFKCYKNRNLHLEFKRQDLLDKFNEMAGRARLRPAS